MERSRKQKLLTRAVVALFSAACLAVGVVHVAEGAELPVTVSIADKEFFVSATGKVVHRVGDAGESLELWTRDDGSAMTVHRYQGVPRSDGFVSPDEYSKQQQEVTDEWGVDLSRTEEVQYFSADEVQVDPDALVPRIIIAATASSISVAWNEEDRRGNRSVYVDGRKVGTSATGSYVISGLRPSHSYDVSVLSEPAEKEAYESHLVRSTSIQATISTTPEAWSSETEARVLAAMSQPAVSAYNHKAFIQNSRVALNWYQQIGCGGAPWEGAQHGGDNRGFVVPTTANPKLSHPDYRTSVHFWVNWQGTPALGFAKSVNPSRKYVNNVLVETRVAGMGNVYASNGIRSGSYASTDINHDVGNPFCTVGSIWYAEHVGLWRSGMVEVFGESYRVPHHEAYFYPGYGTPIWRTLLRTTNVGFDCLTGICGTFPYWEFMDLP